MPTWRVFQKLRLEDIYFKYTMYKQTLMKLLESILPIGVRNSNITISQISIFEKELLILLWKHSDCHLQGDCFKA